MKHSIFIFALYFACLAAMPCQDVAASQASCSTDGCISEVEGREADDQHSDENDTEDCSPFCSCHCCHHAYSVIAVHAKHAFIPLLMENQDSFSLSLFSMELFSIWHPPQV